MTDDLARILIVDDETELMSVLCRGVSAHGYDVVGCESGEEALKELSNDNFDIILTDLMMPGMDGITLLKRAQEIDNSVLGIIMTGQGTIQTAIKAMRMGAYDYILKPFKMNILLQLLSKALMFVSLRKENIELKSTVAMYELTKAVSFSMDENAVLNKVADAAMEQSLADEMSIMLPIKETGELYVAAVRGEGREHLLGKRVKMSDSISGWVARNKENLDLQGRVEDERFASINPRFEIKYALSMPMMAGGTLIGVINLNAIRRRAFTIGQIKALSITIGLAAPALENARLFRNLQSAKEKYQDIFDNAQEGIFEMSPNGKLLMANQALASLLGCSSPEELAETVPEPERTIFPDGKSIEKLKGILREKRTVSSYEITAQKKDGTLIYCLLNANTRHAGKDGLTWRGWLQDVTERRKSRDVLERYRLLTENARDIILFIRSSSGRIIEANNAAVKAYGYSREELLSLTIMDLRFDAPGAIISEMNKAASKGITFETVHKKKGGGTFPVEVSSFGATIGEEIILLSIIRDITERKKSEDRIVENEIKYRTLFESASDGIFLEKDGKLIDCNTRALEMYGGTREQIIGKQITEFYAAHQADSRKSEDVAVNIAKAVYSGIPQLFEWRLTRSDGTVYDAEISLNLMVLKGEKLVLGVARDITERKRVEQIYRTFADNSPVGVYITQNDRFVYVNSQMEHYSGYGAEELIGSKITELIDPDDLESVKRNSNAMLNKASNAPYQYRIAGKHGRIRWLVETVTPITFREVPAVLGSVMDITDRKRAEDDLQRAKEMLIQSEKLAAIGQLASGVAHEVLNPVNIISMRIQLLDMTEGEGLSEQTRETLEICKSQIERVIKISKDLNQFARVSSKERASKDISDLINQIISLITPRLKVERINCQVKFDHSAPQLYMDSDRIGQVILNLINNAIDAMEGKSERILRIKTEYVSSGQLKSVKTVFSDSGSGIETEHINRIFDPFFTTKEIGKGTGLGLSISQAIINDHNGKIWAESNDMGGASFIISLPVSTNDIQGRQ